MTCPLAGAAALGPTEETPPCDPACWGGAGRSDTLAAGAESDPGKEGEDEVDRPKPADFATSDQPDSDVIRRGPLVDEVRLVLPPLAAAAAVEARWPLGTEHLKHALRVP